MNARRHCRISRRRCGGLESDYYPVHELIDSTKVLCSDARHRILHNHWGIRHVVIPIFGHTIVNSDGKEVDVKDLCERDHLFIDYANRFIPTLADFVDAMEMPVCTALQQRIETFHARFAGDGAVSELMLSPLAVTGRLESLLITHNSWFVNAILPRIFPNLSPRVREFSIAPSQFFSAMRFEPWMDNGLAVPRSARNLARLTVKVA